MNTLGMFSADSRAEIGRIRSAGVMESPAVKKDAVRVTLKAAVYTSLMRLPKSKMIFWSSLNSDR